MSLATVNMLKAEMLCSGVAAERDLRGLIQREFDFDTGFIFGSVFLLDGRWPVNTAFLDTDTVTESAPRLEFTDAGDWLISNGTVSLSCPPLRQPPELRRPTSSGQAMHDFIRLHNPDTLFVSPVRQCIFGAAGKPCLYCTYEMKRVEALGIRDFTEMIEVAVAATEATHLAIGGGTPNLSDFGVAYYAEQVAVAKSLGLSVSVEIVPPRDVDRLGTLVAAGVDSLIMSLEVWDRDIRPAVCLGKGELSREHYFDAWAWALEELGHGQVASVLLVGLEPQRSTREGVEALVTAGVTPTLIPYRRYDGLPALPEWRLSPDEYRELATFTQRLMRARGLSAAAHHGCTRCGGCSMEIPEGAAHTAHVA